MKHLAAMATNVEKSAERSKITMLHHSNLEAAAFTVIQITRRQKVSYGTQAVKYREI